MARPFRIEFPGAIYHVMARGNGRQLRFHGQDDCQRMLDGFEKTVWRTGWEVFAFDPLFPLPLDLCFEPQAANAGGGEHVNSVVVSVRIADYNAANRMYSTTR